MVWALVPPGVVTTMLALPAMPVGVMQLMLVSLRTIRLVQTLPLIVTEVAPVKPVPVIVMEVFPGVGPAQGETLVTLRGCGKSTEDLNFPSP